MSLAITKKHVREKEADEERLGFNYFTDHMFVMDYIERAGTTAHRPLRPASRAVMVLHYGREVFRGLGVPCRRRPRAPVPPERYAAP